MGIKEWLCNFLGCCEPESGISPPNYLEEIGYDEVYSTLNAEFPECTLLLSDNRYKTTTKQELMRFLKEDNTDKYGYVSEWFDCNNFSYHLHGNISSPSWGCLPFGILWTTTSGGGHAINCFVDNNREIWLIEPQNDLMFKLDSKPIWKPYVVMM